MFVSVLLWVYYLRILTKWFKWSWKIHLQEKRIARVVLLKINCYFKYNMVWYFAPKKIFCNLLTLMLFQTSTTFFLLWKTQIKLFLIMLVTMTEFRSPLTSIVWRRKRVSKWWQNFVFGWTYKDNWKMSLFQMLSYHFCMNVVIQHQTMCSCWNVA